MKKVLILVALVALVCAAVASAYTYNGTNGPDSIIGSQYADTINGKDGSDFLDGRGGNDVIRGDAGNDDLWGDVGNDKLYAGSGWGLDELYAEGGGDTVGMDNGLRSVAVGGPGNDTVYADSASLDDWTGFEKVIVNGVCQTGC